MLLGKFNAAHLRMLASLGWVAVRALVFKMRWVGPLIIHTNTSSAAPIPAHAHAHTSNLQEFEAREVVVRQGETADCLYVIRSGQVSQSTHT